MVPHLSKQPKVYDRVTLLIRDPFDSLLAEFHRQFSGEQHTGFASIEKFSKPCTEKDQVRELWGTVYSKVCFEFHSIAIFQNIFIFFSIRF